MHDAFENKPNNNVLFVDVGGTNIRAAVLPDWSPPEFFKALAENPELKMRRKMWNPKKDGGSLASLITERVAGDLEIHRAVISIPGKVSLNGREYKGWLKGGLTWKGVPKNLAATIEKTIPLTKGSVNMLNDAAAWGQGTRALMRDRGVWILGGVGMLTVGSGVGFSIVTSSGVTAKELWSGYNWSKLNHHARHRDTVHVNLARDYFEWREKQKWDADRKAEDAGIRLRLVLEELARRHQIKNFVVGGGYAKEFMACDSKFNIAFLTQESLGFDPDFIPMIGLNA
jgi:predicted NBD/HSP70 family sugar kinase